MSPNSAFPGRSGPPPVRLHVWDLPTRIFHWSLVVLTTTSFITGKIGGNAMQWHGRSGFAILTLILFRLLWGLFGSRSARFASFLRGPAAVFAYARNLFGGGPVDHIGHNPLGGWSIAAMLAALLFQAASGLFSDDGIITQGPLAHLVSGTLSALLTRWHRINQVVILLLVMVHIGAILFYWSVKRTNLIAPMITGIKRWNGPLPPQPLTGSSWPALFAAAVAIGIVYWVVR